MNSEYDLKVFEQRAPVKTLEKECIEEVMFLTLIISCQQAVFRSHRQILCHSANERSCHVSYRDSVTEEDPHPHHTDPHSICCRTPRISAHHDLLLYSAVKMLSAASQHLILYNQRSEKYCAPALTLMFSKSMWCELTLVIVSLNHTGHSVETHILVRSNWLSSNPGS